MTKKLDDPWINIASFDKMNIYVKGSNSNFQKQQQRDTCKKAKTELVSKFWLAYAAQSNDAREANCELVNFDGEITIGKTKVEIVIPRLTNSRDLKDGDEIILLSTKRAKTK